MWPSRVVDLLFLLGVIATSATGLGFGTAIVSSSISELTSMQEGFGATNCHNRRCNFSHMYKRV